MRQVPQWATIPRMLREQAMRHGDALAVADGAARLRLAQLREQATYGARALIAMGAEPGDRIAIMAPNSFRWAISAFAVWDTGAVVVPVPTGFGGAYARHVLVETQASMLLACDDHPHGTSSLALLGRACGEPSPGRPYARLPHLRTVVLLAENAEARGAWSAGGRPGVLRLRSLLARGASVAASVAEQRALAVQSTDVCEIVFVPGSGGAPTAIALDHARLLSTYWGWSDAIGLSEADRFVVAAPFSQGFGLNGGLLAGVLKAAAILTAPQMDDPAALLALIERHRASVLAGPPALFYRLLDCLLDRPGGVPSLRVAICEAPAVPAELTRRLLAQTRVRQVINAHGLVEAPSSL